MLTQLPRRDWQRYFDRVSAALAERAAQVDVTGLDEALCPSFCMAKRPMSGGDSAYRAERTH